MQSTRNWPWVIAALDSLCAAHRAGFDAVAREKAYPCAGPYLLADARERSGVFPGVDALDMAVAWERFPSVCAGLSSNSESRELSRYLSVKLFEYERDRRTNEPGEVAFEFSARFVWDGVPYCFALFYLIFRRRKTVGNVTHSHRLEITGTACRLFGHEKILEILIAVGLQPKKLRELHLAADFFLPREESQPLQRANRAARDDKEQTGVDFVHKGVLETVNVGEDDRKKNTYRFFRIYDKDADTLSKGKQRLYPIGGRSRIRYEMELRKDKCAEFPWQWLLDPQKLKSVWEYECRAYVKNPGGIIPASWGSFHDTKRGENVPDTYRDKFNKRLSDRSRRNWAQAQGWIDNMFEEGATLADVVAGVVHFWHERKNGVKRTALESRRSSRGRRS